jgi:hypothetical protein
MVKTPILEAEHTLLRLLELSNGERSYEEQNSIEYVKNGISNMIRIMKANEPVTSSPIDEKERSDFL